jgi:hypothetical protein
MYKKEITMHRTQLYFDEALYEEVKQTAKRMNITILAYIIDRGRNAAAGSMDELTDELVKKLLTV